MRAVHVAVVHLEVVDLGLFGVGQRVVGGVRVRELRVAGAVVGGLDAAQERDAVRVVGHRAVDVPVERAALDRGVLGFRGIEADDPELAALGVVVRPDVHRSEHVAERDEVVVVDVRAAVDDDTVRVERGFARLRDVGIDERASGEPGDLDADLGLDGGNGDAHTRREYYALLRSRSQDGSGVPCIDRFD